MIWVTEEKKSFKRAEETVSSGDMQIYLEQGSEGNE